ncbi:MAG: carboxypeptidase regulatory-like domain-containing protein [Desulfobacterales bacterium]|nr:carboxypeptidase regulatory-like domain-containing protein [Desulfobacterales bacterium]
MNLLRWFVIVFLWATIPLAGGFAAADPGATISGVLGIELGDGSTAHGDWIRVLLTTEAVAVPMGDIPSDLPFFVRRDRINDLHLRFFVNVQKRMGNPGFVVATTLTTEDGSFRFTEVPPGNYHILVTFPAVIAGVKAAWQIPVRVAADPDVAVTLNSENVALPLAIK